MTPLERTLIKSKSKNWVVSFLTRHPDGDVLDGIVKVIRDKFIAVATHNEFVHNGTLILSKNRIKSCRDGKSEIPTNRIIRANGTLTKCKVPKWLESSTSLKEVLETLKAKDIWPGVEILSNSGTETSFYIGPITYVDGRTFGIHCYDVKGKWQNVYDLKLSEIFKIQIGDSYTTHFNNYMKRP